MKVVIEGQIAYKCDRIEGNSFWEEGGVWLYVQGTETTIVRPIVSRIFSPTKRSQSHKSVIAKPRVDGTASD